MNIRVLREAGGLGDLVRLFPVIAGLKAKYPGSELHFFCLGHYQELVMHGHCPGVDAYISVAHHLRRQRMSPIDEKKHRYLRTGVKYDLDVDMYCPAFVHERETQGAVTRERTELWCAAVGVPVGRPVFHLAEEERAWAQAWRTKALQPLCPDVDTSAPGRIVALQPHSTTTQRNWAARSWQELAMMFMQEGYAVVMLDCCSGRFRGWPSTLQEVNRPFGQLAALLSVCGLAITPDSGIYHLAGAVGTPALGIFGNTNGEIISRIWRPTGYHISKAEADLDRDLLPADCKPPCYGFRDRGAAIECRKNGCGAAHQITVEEVHAKAHEIIAEHWPNRRDGGLPAEGGAGVLRSGVLAGRH